MGLLESDGLCSDPSAPSPLWWRFGPILPTPALGAPAPSPCPHTTCTTPTRRHIQARASPGGTQAPRTDPDEVRNQDTGPAHSRAQPWSAGRPSSPGASGQPSGLSRPLFSQLQDEGDSCHLTGIGAGWGRHEMRVCPCAQDAGPGLPRRERVFLGHAWGGGRASWEVGHRPALQQACRRPTPRSV